MKKIRSLKSSVFILILSAAVLALNAAPVFAFNPIPQISQDTQPTTDKNLGQLLAEFFEKIYKAMEEKLGNNHEFFRKFFTYKQNAQSLLGRFFNQVGMAINQWTNSQSPMYQSSTVFLRNINKAINNLWASLNQFPMFAEIKRIVSPILNHLVYEVNSNLPKKRTGHVNNNPLGSTINYYTDVSNKNPYEVGPLFEIPRLQNYLTTKDENEDLNDATNRGVAKPFVRLRETTEIENEVLQFHELVLNNMLKKRFEKEEDLTIMHGMPEQMRNDGVDPRVIAFVEEYNNLSNYHLRKNYEENGLIVNINHPQAKIPKGYTPETFVEKFTNLLKSWQDKAGQTFNSIGEKINSIL